jgi:hypothetical protein
MQERQGTSELLWSGEISTARIGQSPGVILIFFVHRLPSPLDCI